MSYICRQARMGLLRRVWLRCWIPWLFASITWCVACQMGVPNLAVSHFWSLTLVSDLGTSADHISLLAVRVSTSMLLLAGWGVLLVLLWVTQFSRALFALRFNVVLHPLCGDWPSLWSSGPMMSLSSHPALLAADAVSLLYCFGPVRPLLLCPLLIFGARATYLLLVWSVLRLCVLPACLSALLDFSQT